MMRNQRKNASLARSFAVEAVARTLRRCSEGSLRSSFESDTSEMAPPNSSEGGGRDEEMGV